MRQNNPRKQNVKRCKFFNTRNGCKNGLACPYAHVINRKKKREKKKEEEKSEHEQREKQKEWISNQKRILKDYRRKFYAKKQHDDEGSNMTRKYNDRSEFNAYGGWRILHYQERQYESKEKTWEKEKFQKNTLRHERTRKRLLKDLKEISQSSLVTISALPVDNDLFRWHCNLLGPEGSEYEGIPIHLEVLFGESYPNKPPKVYLFTSVPHTHIFPGFICLDLLGTHSALPREGWTTAYSLLSVLMQLQTFLFYDEDRRGKLNLEKYNKSCYKAMNFKCATCKHNMKEKHPYPWSKIMQPINYDYQNYDKEELLNNKRLVCKAGTEKIVEISKKEEPSDFTSVSNGKEGKTNDSLMILPLELIRYEILTFFNTLELLSFQRVSTVFYRLIKKMINLNEDSLVCFHSKKMYLEKDTILGYGITICLSPFKRDIQYCQVPSLDYLDYYSFIGDNVKKGVYKSPFENFLPLYLTKTHAQKSWPLFQRLMIKYTKIGRNVNYFNPILVIDLLLKIMNTCVVYTINGTDHCSEKFLIGYFHTYRLLLEVVLRYPEVKKNINERVERFISKETDIFRRKKNEDNIGNFLQILTISELTWDEVIPMVLSEQWDRNVMWMLKKYPECKYNIEKERRLLCSWESNSIPCYLIMFNHAFYNLIRPWEKLEYEKIAEILDSNFGHPSLEVRIKFQKEIFEIQKINNYDDFFKKIGLKPTKTIEQTLCDSIINSQRKNYHQNNNVRYNNRGYRNNRNMMQNPLKRSWSPWANQKPLKANKDVLEKISKLKKLEVKYLPFISSYVDVFGTLENEIRFVKTNCKKKKKVKK